MEDSKRRTPSPGRTRQNVCSVVNAYMPLPMKMYQQSSPDPLCWEVLTRRWDVSSASCSSALGEAIPKNWMHWYQNGRIVHHSVHLRLLKSKLSSRDVSILCCCMRHSTRVQACNWMAFLCARSKWLVPPRLYTAGASSVSLADSYSTKD